MNSDFNKPQNTVSLSVPEPDELLMLVKFFRLLWRKKWWLTLGTALFTAAGIVYALYATPVFTSTAVIAPKEAEKNTASGMLSQMGSFGSIVGTQMGFGGTKLEHIAIFVTSHDMAEKIISKHNLLPQLFHKKYNFQTNKWTFKDTLDIPTIRHGIKELNEQVLSVSTDIKKSIITLQVNFYDSILSAQVASWYLDELDHKIKSDIVAEANSKRAYLDAQMKATADPWMIQKLQNLAGMEVEKTMLVAGASFTTLESPMVPLKKTKPNRKLIVISFFICGILTTGIVLALIDYLKKYGLKIFNF